MRPIEEFKAGIYQHYKGGRYVALFLVRHHETGEPMVVYTCCERGTTSVREWDSPGKASWSDTWRLGVKLTSRFTYVGPSVLS